MKLRLIGLTAFVALAGAMPALAQTYYTPAPAVVVDTTPPYMGERIYVPAVRPGSAIHGGWVAPEDEQLLGSAIAAIASERDLNGMTVTMVANNGELILNGIAQNPSQAARVERIAKRVANGHVTSRFDTQGS